MMCDTIKEAAGGIAIALLRERRCNTTPRQKGGIGAGQRTADAYSAPGGLRNVPAELRTSNLRQLQIDRGDIMAP